MESLVYTSDPRYEWRVISEIRVTSYLWDTSDELSLRYEWRVISEIRVTSYLWDTSDELPLRYEWRVTSEIQVTSYLWDTSDELLLRYEWPLCCFFTLCNYNYQLLLRSGCDIRFRSRLLAAISCSDSHHSCSHDPARVVSSPVLNSVKGSLVHFTRLFEPSTLHVCNLYNY